MTTSARSGLIFPVKLGCGTCTACVMGINMEFHASLDAATGHNNAVDTHEHKGGENLVSLLGQLTSRGGYQHLFCGFVADIHIVVETEQALEIGFRLYIL